MEYTGVFATKKERIETIELTNIAQNTSVIAITSKDALSGNDLASRAWRRVHEFCHSCALKHGLPEIKGFYGMTQEGEFVKEEEQK